jgi:putative polyketide hydroxylase
MLSSDSHDAPVLVVGAGPAGLAAAVELARLEIPTLLVERRTTISSHPRATVLSLRSMELMRAWGLDADVRAHSAEVDSRMLESETLAAAAAGTPIQVGYPSAEQSQMISPTAPACVAQDHVEAILLEHLRASPFARIELGTELTRVLADGEGVRADLRDLRTGALRTVEASYLVAADGARSPVREALGIRLVGPDNLMQSVTTLLRAPLWELVGDHRHLIYSITHAAAPGVFVPTGASDRWLFGGGDDDGSDERLTAELVRTAAGVPDLPVRIERSRYFSAGAQLAEQWRSGPIFLTGDAAHRVTPRGGTGLNLALHDGYDLGWKLGWVLRGWAGPELLDSYEAERRPVAEYTAARSADPSGSRRPAEDEVRVDLGSRMAHVWAGERSTLDLLGPALTLFAARGAATWRRAAAELGTRVPVVVRLLDPMATRALGAPGGSALLARPDGTPLAVLPASSDPLPSLRAAVAAIA